MLKNELVSLIGDVLLEQRRHEEGHKEKGTERRKKWKEKEKEEEERRMKDVDGRRDERETDCLKSANMLNGTHII